MARKKTKTKGMSQADYIIAAGMFIVVFALVAQFALSYYSSSSEAAEVLDLNSDGRSLLMAADYEPVPSAWPEIDPNKETGLVLLMHFNNESRYSEGTTSFNDFSAQGNDGSCSGTACPYYTWNATLGGGMVFDGVDDFVNVSTLGVMKTVEYWKKNSTDSAWHHIANSSGTMYFDGVSTSLRTIYVTNTSGNILIGINETGSYFNGTIDEVAIYNRALGAGEIMNHYNYGLRNRRVGLRSDAYRFLIVVNNTASNYYNPGVSPVNLATELVVFNYSEMGYNNVDYKSTKIYDDMNMSLPYQINGDNITFVADVNASQARWYIVYFDDDSIFEDRSSAVTGVDNLSETRYAVEKINVLQFRKIMDLNRTNYTAARNLTEIGSEFRIRIYDVNTSSYFYSFGSTPPRRGDIVSFQRYMLYQNSTADINRGRMRIQVWTE